MVLLEGIVLAIVVHRNTHGSCTANLERQNKCGLLARKHDEPSGVDQTGGRDNFDERSRVATGRIKADFKLGARAVLVR